jgi:hypothetical protein
MSDRLAVSTRKGLFWIDRNGGGWRVAGADFLGDNVTLTLHDRRSGCDYAALNHGHFGIKLHRRDDGGPWKEIAAPAYPQKPEGVVDRDGWGKDIPYNLRSRPADRRRTAFSGAGRFQAVSFARAITERAGS